MLGPIMYTNGDIITILATLHITHIPIPIPNPIPMKINTFIYYMIKLTKWIAVTCFYTFYSHFDDFVLGILERNHNKNK